MIAVSVTLFFTFKNAPISLKRIAKDNIFTQIKYCSATIITLSDTQSHLTMFICTRIFQMNINVCSFFDDKGRALHLSVMSKKLRACGQSSLLERTIRINLQLA